MTSSNKIHIFITHDLILGALNYGWFGETPHQFWPTYLGGKAFYFEKDHVILLSDSGFIKKEIPFWFK
jgi:hypothetical protein